MFAKVVSTLTLEKFTDKTFPRFFVSLLLIAIGLGIGFRVYQLDGKIYSHDEVYTSLRVAGFTWQEFYHTLFQNRLVSRSELLHFQQLKVGSSVVDTWHSLVVEDPQHPPLYFVLARFWMEIFGSSVIACRSLPALLSLIGLPLMYGLAWELFAAPNMALLGTALLALSPFDILFAQTARQYSLLMTLVIAGGFLLLRSWRLQDWRSWGLYTGVMALGLYTHPFFCLSLIGHGVFILGMNGVRFQELLKAGKVATFLRGIWGSSLPFLLAVFGATILYLPWLVVMVKNFRQAYLATAWTQQSPGLLPLLRMWQFNFTSLLFDLDFGIENGWTYLLRLPTLVLILVAIFTLVKTPGRLASWFMLTSILVPFLILAIPDLLLGGLRSGISRYLVGCYPSILLAVAYWFATKLPTQKSLWRLVFAGVLTGSLISATVSAFSETWWTKDVSFLNPEVARIINHNPAPILVSDLGAEYTNSGDVISLSYLFHPEVRLLLVNEQPSLQSLDRNAVAFVLRPSSRLQGVIKQAGFRLDPVFEAGKLWQLRPENTTQVR